MGERAFSRSVPDVSGGRAESDSGGGGRDKPRGGTDTREGGGIDDRAESARWMGVVPRTDRCKQKKNPPDSKFVRNGLWVRG